MIRRIYQGHPSFYSIPKGAKVTEFVAGGRCPLCDSKADYRSGVGFENEKICMKCSVVWEPGEPAKLVEIEGEPWGSHPSHQEAVEQMWGKKND